MAEPVEIEFAGEARMDYGVYLPCIILRQGDFRVRFWAAVDEDNADCLDEDEAVLDEWQKRACAMARAVKPADGRG